VSQKLQSVDLFPEAESLMKLSYQNQRIEVIQIFDFLHPWQSSSFSILLRFVQGLIGLLQYH